MFVERPKSSVAEAKLSLSAPSPAPAPAPNKILKDTLTITGTFFDLSTSTFLHGFMNVVPK
jgi:hypothetical protein